MTLGRTSSGAIKIKTDSPPGLRAVECACCDPCTGYAASGLIITKEQYLSWRKGGSIQLSASISDSSPKAYNDPSSCDNGRCDWSYSTSFNVPSNTCILNFTHIGDSVSCQSNYYGETQSPSVVIYAGAYRSLDESGEIYRARLFFSAFCPFRLFFAGGCYMDMCWNNTTYGGFANTGNIPFTAGDASISFLGATFWYYNNIPFIDFPPSTADLQLTFTPNP
jgi:hypothetical protein